MYLRRLSIVLGLFVACAAGAAVVYKWTDADGVIHYSDQAVPGAEKIITASGSSNGIGGAVPSVAGPALPKPAASGLGYEMVNIDSPNPEQVFFADQLVTVHLGLEPPQKPGHTIAWQLNGQPLDDENNVPAFSLQSLPRGTYSIVATLSDGKISQSSNSVTFYVRQPSILAPLNKSR
jgi:hypothetical protein